MLCIVKYTLSLLVLYWLLKTEVCLIFDYFVNPEKVLLLSLYELKNGYKLEIL